MERKFDIVDDTNDIIRDFMNFPTQSINIAAFEPVSTSLQALHLSLQRIAANKKMNVLQFLSSIRQEGTSTIASNYAVLVAQSHLIRRNGVHNSKSATVTVDKNRVLLIDANLRNPTLHTVFGIQNEIGLSNIIYDGNSLNEAITSISDTQLDVLPTGSITENPTRILKSDALNQLINRFKSMYSLIIIDSAPIVPYSDSLTFAHQVDGSVLVIEAGQTRREVIESARKKIDFAGMRILGVVLNKRQYHIPKSIYKHI